MLQTILICLILINLIFSISKRKSRLTIIISTVLIAFIFAGSRDMADWENYYSDYLRGDGNYNRNGQFGYYYIVKCFNYLGLSFNVYRIVISVICLSIYNRFIFKYSPNPNLVYVAYLSYLMFLDDVQLRNFIACAVLYIGIQIIIEHRPKWRWKYFLICVIAALIHNSFWIYLLFLAIPNDLENDSLVKKIGFIGVVAIVIAVFIRPFISSIVLMFTFIASKAEGYAEMEIGLGGLVYVIAQLIGLFCILLIKHKTKVDNKSKSVKKYKFLKIVILINILSFVFLPMVILAMPFYRLVRNLYILNIVAFTWGIKEKKTRFISLLIYTIYIAIFVYIDLVDKMGQRIIIEPFFNNNIYFQ